MSEDKRLRILAAAAEVFCREGLEGASMDHIAREAGVAKGTLYLYFSGKDDLVEQVYWQCHQEDVQACQQGLDQLTGAIAKLERRLENVVRWALGNPVKIKMERLYFTSPKYGRQGRYQNQKLHFQAVDQIMREGLAAGELKQLPSPLLGEIFFGIGEAVLNYLTENPDKLDDRRFWRICGQMVEGCLKKAEP